MDEPLGALDKKLREQMQVEIKRIHRSVGTTVIYVTHDQTEALTMSDPRRGDASGPRGPGGHAARPLRSARQPVRGRFPGDSIFLTATVAQVCGDEFAVEIGSGEKMHVTRVPAAPGSRAVVLIRPEDISVTATG